jgi:uncharacterized protein (DUF2141 family)
MACLTIALTLSACSGSRVSQKSAEERPPGEGTVNLRIEGVESRKGLVYASVYLTPEGFPEDKSLAHTYLSAPAEAAVDGVLEFSFAELPAGWFVIAVLHDEDGDEELTMGLIGIPEEKYGFSLNPDSLFGPPPFDESAVFLEDGETRALTINIQ